MDEIDAHKMFDVWILHFSGHPNGGAMLFLNHSGIRCLVHFPFGSD